MKYLIRPLLSFYLAILLLVSSVAPVFAVNTIDPGGGGTPGAPTAGTNNNFTGSLGEFQQALGGNQYGKELFDFQSLVGTMSSLTTLLIGCIDTNCPQNLSQGAIPTVGIAIAGIYANPPASGMYYLADTAGRLNIVQPAYAQTGTGFEVLRPFLNIWRAVRNLTYVLFALGIVGLGLAIMFRSKISPQAVITIQSALPRVIIALLLITFSYAIVGFLIDLTYLVFGLLVFGLQAGGLYDSVGATRRFEEYTTAGFNQTMGFVLQRGLGGGYDVISSDPGLAAAGIGAGLLGIAGGIILAIPGVGAAVAAVAGTIITTTLVPVVLGLLVAILFFLFRILFALARAYILLLIYLIFAPFFILWSSLTGVGIWGGWLKGLMANLLVFPAVGIIIFLVDVLILQIDTVGGNVWGPPYIGQQPGIIKGMIALGAVMLLPTLPDMISQFLGERAPQFQLPAAQNQLQRTLDSLSQQVQRVREVGAGGPRRT